MMYMLNAFQLKNNCLSRIEVNDPWILHGAIWVDLVEPSDDECDRVYIALGQSIIKSFEFKNIAKATRFFKDDNGDLHIHSFFLYNDENHASSVIVVFIISNNRLYTLREREIPVFRIYQMSINSNTVIDGNAYALFLDLFVIKLEHLADNIEDIYFNLEKLSLIIMDGQQVDEYDHALSTLATLEDIGWKIRLCLLDTQRAINFLVRTAQLSSSQIKQAREMLYDIECLLPHNDSLFQKINFLIQAAMGFINIEQNRVIKIFSVVFLPPTLVASSYGMNFEFMPELKWSFGYPGAIILMILAGLAPYIYFKYKNWL